MAASPSQPSPSGASPAGAAAGAVAQAATGPVTTAVWDPFVRLFHWSLAAAFLLNHFITKPGGPVHNWLGYLALALVAARVVWGFVSPNRYARFSAFVPAPRTLLTYARGVLGRRDARHIGHNPAGAAMIVALLALMTLTGITGWMTTTDRFWGVAWVEETHSALSHLLVALVVLHVLGALYESWRHGENLVLAMVTGRKRADDAHPGGGGAARD